MKETEKMQIRETLGMAAQVWSQVEDQLWKEARD